MYHPTRQIGMFVRAKFVDIYLQGMRDRSMRSGTELAREIQLADWSTAGNLSNRSSGVPIPRDICARLKPYLYSAKCSWIIYVVILTWTYKLTMAFFGVIWIRIGDPRSLRFMVHQSSRWNSDQTGFIGSFDFRDLWWMVNARLRGAETSAFLRARVILTSSMTS